MASSLLRFVGFLIAVVRTSSAHAEPPIRLEFRTGPEGRIGGYVVDSGPCRFAMGRRVLDGRMEGGAFVGSVLLCHEPQSCGERAYPLLALPLPAGRGWVAHLSSDEGCASPLLRGGRLLVEKAEEVGLGAAVPPPVGASRRARELLERGRLHLDRREFAQASHLFQSALSYEEDRWDGYAGLGLAELRRGNAHRAVDALERGVDLAKVAGQEPAELFFSLACARSRLGQTRKAVDALREALKLGLERPERLSSEPDLATLRGEPEFAAWTQAPVRTRSRK